MTALPFTLTRDDTNDDQCCKCAALKRRGESKRTTLATYTLSQGAAKWRLCTNCAARSAHALGLRHHVFRPEGNTLVTKE